MNRTEREVLKVMTMEIASRAMETKIAHGNHAKRNRGWLNKSPTYPPPCQSWLAATRSASR